MTGCSYGLSCGVGSCRIGITGIGASACAMSCAVMTACTPGCASAPEVSMRPISLPMKALLFRDWSIWRAPYDHDYSGQARVPRWPEHSTPGFPKLTLRGLLGVGDQLRN